MKRVLFGVLLSFSTIFGDVIEIERKIYTQVMKSTVVAPEEIENYYSVNKEHIEGRIEALLTKYSYARKEYFQSVQGALMDIMCDQCRVNFHYCSKVLTPGAQDALSILLFDRIYGTLE